MPSWSAIANDIVVNEKRLFGSRCGPMGPALELLRDPSTKRLVNSMVDAVYTIDDGIEAFEMARKKGSLKVQIAFESVLHAPFRRRAGPCQGLQAYTTHPSEADDPAVYR